MRLEDSVQHLWQFSNSLSADRHATRLLKSYYINTCRTLLKSKTPYSGEMCTHCALFWSENEFDLKLIPQAKSTKSAKSQKLIAKLEEAQKTPVQGLLTRKQKKRAKWLKKRAQSQLEIHCKFCQHKSTIPLEKPKKQKVQSSEQTEETITKTTSKKKKRKDKTAGLKIVAPTTKIASNTAATTPQKNNSKQQNAVNKIKPQSKSKKQNQKAKTAVISKTQQQNKLLQLAEMLKKQSSNNKSTTQSRLNALMK